MTYREPSAVYSKEKHSDPGTRIAMIFWALIQLSCSTRLIFAFFNCTGTSAHKKMVQRLASYLGLPMWCIERACEKLGKPGRLCDVMMTCGHYLGRGLKSSPICPHTFFMCAVPEYVATPHALSRYTKPSPTIYPSAVLSLGYQALWLSRA